MNFTIRDALEEDLLGVAQVKIDTWRSTYRGIIRDELLDGLDLQEQAEKFGDLLFDEKQQKFLIIAENEGKIIGFAAGGRERSGEYEITGEIYAIYVLAEVQNQGIGKALLYESFIRLNKMNLRSILLWVLEQNQSRKFYEKYGGREIDKKIMEIAGDQHLLLGYAWKEVDIFR